MPIHRHEHFSPQALVAAKGALRVSVVIPARNEAETVGRVVSDLRAALDRNLGLVDEWVVMDSDSSDATAAVAASAGATVYAAGSVRPDLGVAHGKGEALWKALLVTSGDVLVFVDADLFQWGPHFVTGLLGPVLTDPSIHLVKAVYDRPMVDAQGHEEEVGGRVTELVARPLIALHRPRLAHIVQPLSGEWAIRREAFESFSVPMGYGVEIAALLDVDTQFGPDAIAQVDLGRRTHRHHRHDALGEMALQVMAAAEHRLSGGGPAGNAPSESGLVTLRQFSRGADGFQPRPRAVNVGERPPVRDLTPAAAAWGER
ncbi:MAG: glucosyl-3-phosphoglycerate synthase [Nostocoides sp.]